MIIANLIIADDVGVVTEEQLIKIPDEQLPMTKPHVGIQWDEESHNCRLLEMPRAIVPLRRVRLTIKSKIELTPCV